MKLKMYIKEEERGEKKIVMSLTQGSFISANKQLSMLQIFMTLKVV